MAYIFDNKRPIYKTEDVIYLESDKDILNIIQRLYFFISFFPEKRKKSRIAIKNKQIYKKKSEFMHLTDPKILLIIYSFIGIITAHFAKKHGRNPYLWFALGVIFGVSALVITFFLNFKTKKRKSMLIQEAISVMNQQIKFNDSTFWYYLNGEEKNIGPMSTTKLHSLYKSGTIGQLTYIWNKEFEEWKRLKDTKIYHLFTENKNAIV